MARMVRVARASGSILGSVAQHEIAESTNTPCLFDRRLFDRHRDQADGMVVNAQADDGADADENAEC